MNTQSAKARRVRARGRKKMWANPWFWLALAGFCAVSARDLLRWLGWGA
jgi:hypothetical protein